MRLPLETNRLRLRPFQDADIAPFAAYRADPEVSRYQVWDTPYSRDQAAAFVTEMKAKQPGIPGEGFQIALELKATKTLIGDCFFRILAEDNQQAIIGFSLASAYQGQGLATEAVSRLLATLFDDLELHRVTAICDVANHSSVNLLERVGMRREGHFVANVWFKGAGGSEYVYAILKREWRGSGKRPFYT